MSTKYFNFNNESNLTEVDVHDETGVVTFTLGEQSVEFATIGEFAEYYATARNVLPDNLKNWVLTEDGDQIAFVLRAGTAGMDADEITSLAAGLRAAGMSPEEIGRAIAAASGGAVDGVVTPVSGDVVNRGSLRQQIVRNDLDERSDLDLALLRKVTMLEGLALINHLVTNGNFDDDEGWDDGEESFSCFVSDLIYRAKEAARAQFSNAPRGVAEQLYVDYEGNLATQDKVSMVAMAAGRAPQVQVYNRIDNVLEHRMATPAQITNTLNEPTLHAQLFEINKRLVIVHQ